MPLWLELLVRGETSTKDCPLSSPLVFLGGSMRTLI